jgi:hypothetical protein
VAVVVQFGLSNKKSDRNQQSEVKEKEKDVQFRR